MRVRSVNDVLIGCFLILLGAWGLWLMRGAPMGTLGRMSTGFLPTVLGWLMIGNGIAVIVRAFLVAEPGPSRVHWRPLAAIMAALAVFAAATPVLGLAAGTILLVLVATAAERDARWLTAIVLAVTLAVFCSIVFVRLLGIPLPILPGFIGS